MVFFVPSTDAPVTVPEGTERSSSVYTGTACLAAMDSQVTAEVWEDLLYDGTGHDHAAGGLMTNSAALGTHLEHDGDFPVRMVLDHDGQVLAFAVNLDPYAEDLNDVRHLDLHGDGQGHDHEHSHGSTTHSHLHSHEHDHTHAEDDDHGHSGDHGHGDGWSSVTRIQMVGNKVLFGDPAGLPEADATGGLLEMTFPDSEGTLTASVYTEHGMRRELLVVWSD